MICHRWSLLVGFAIKYLLANSRSTPRIEYHESGRCCELRPGYLDKCKSDQRIQRIQRCIDGLDVCKVCTPSGEIWIRPEGIGTALTGITGCLAAFKPMNPID